MSEYTSQQFCIDLRKPQVPKKSAARVMGPGNWRLGGDFEPPDGENPRPGRGSTVSGTRKFGFSKVFQPNLDQLRGWWKMSQRCPGCDFTRFRARCIAFSVYSKRKSLRNHVEGGFREVRLGGLNAFLGRGNLDFRKFSNRF